jgi:hypothetical protein
LFDISDCGSPNEPNAALCVKCKSALRLQDAVSISTVQKKLEDQNKTIEKMQSQLDVLNRYMNGILDEEDERDVEEDSEDDEEKDREEEEARAIKG